MKSSKKPAAPLRGFRVVVTENAMSYMGGTGGMTVPGTTDLYGPGFRFALNGNMLQVFDKDDQCVAIYALWLRVTVDPPDPLKQA